MNKGIYQAGPIKRNRRTKAEVEQLENQIYDVLAADHPQSVRHVYYRMTDPNLPEPVEKTEKGYNQVQQRCTVMRRDGRLPFHWFSDTTRKGHFVSTFDNASDFVRRVAGLYRSDLWAGAECKCEVWTESRSLAGVVMGDCNDLAVDLYPAGGFSSITFAHEAAEALNNTYDGRPVVVFYIGDYDPAGDLIDKALERELRKHIRPHVDMRFERLAINSDQIAHYALPKKPRKKSDRRALHIQETVEAEAMPAHLMRELLRDRIEALLPPDALSVTKFAEEAERNFLKTIAEQMEVDE